MPGGKSPKAKGSRFEVELAHYLNTHVFDGEVVVHRAPLSGGGKSFFSGGEADLNGTPHIWVEAKRTERFSPYAAIEQAERGLAGRKRSLLPVVVSRRNRAKTGESLVVMRLDDWLHLYRAILNLENLS
jgi:hypothetical protein